MLFATLQLFAFLNGIVFLVVPIYCLYVYLTRKIRGAIIIATGFILAFAIEFFTPPIISRFLSPESFQIAIMSISLIGNVVLAASLIYGLGMTFREVQ